jgi:magnesium-transporting ATPase (P-type)
MKTYTLIHTIISLLALFSGFVVLFGLLTNRKLPGWTAFFLTTTVATSVTGFGFFPALGFTPGQVFGILSMILLALAIYGRYVQHLAGGWRKVYVLTAVAALYLNAFVGVVQSFQKIPVLKALAPTQPAPVFIGAQVVALVLFIVAGIYAVKNFQGDPILV